MAAIGGGGGNIRPARAESAVMLRNFPDFGALVFWIISSEGIPSGTATHFTITLKEELLRCLRTAVPAWDALIPGLGLSVSSSEPPPPSDPLDLRGPPRSVALYGDPVGIVRFLLKKYSDPDKVPPWLVYVFIDGAPSPSRSYGGSPHSAGPVFNERYVLAIQRTPQGKIMDAGLVPAAHIDELIARSSWPLQILPGPIVHGRINPPDIIRSLNSAWYRWVYEEIPQYLCGTRRCTRKSPP